MSNSFINKIKDIIQYKTTNKNTNREDIVILNPDIEDIIEHNIFKLEYNEHIYFVPLWHTELYYDISNNDTNNDIDELIVNDSSTDSTENIITKICEKNSKIKLINLSRNYSHQPALLCG